MRLKILLLAALASGPATVLAETQTVVRTAEGTEVIVVTGSAARPTASVLPSKGMTKSAVAQSYGQPSQKRAAVGGGSPRQPPITRWDYDGYTVIFENNHVVDTVQHGNPAPIQVRDGLASAAP